MANQKGSFPVAPTPAPAPAPKKPPLTLPGAPPPGSATLKTPEAMKAEYDAAQAAYKAKLEAAKANVDRIRLQLKGASGEANQRRLAGELAAAESAYNAIKPSPEKAQAVREVGAVENLPATMLPTLGMTGDKGYAASSTTVKPVPAAPPAPKPARVAPAPSPAPAVPEAPLEREYGDKTREFEEAERSRVDLPGMDVPIPETVDNIPIEEPAPVELAKPEIKEIKQELKTAKYPDPAFGQKLKDLAGKFGMGILDILEAVGYQRGGISKQTNLEKRYLEKLDAEQKAYMAKLESDRMAREEEQYARRSGEERQYQTGQAEAERAFAAQQKEADRIADKEAQGIALSAQEKMLKMEIAGRQAAAQQSASPKPPASLIPQ